MYFRDHLENYITGDGIGPLVSCWPQNNWRGAQKERTWGGEFLTLL